MTIDKDNYYRGQSRDYGLSPNIVSFFVNIENFSEISYYQKTISENKFLRNNDNLKVNLPILARMQQFTLLMK